MGSNDACEVSLIQHVFDGQVSNWISAAATLSDAFEQHASWQQCLEQWL